VDPDVVAELSGTLQKKVSETFNVSGHMRGETSY